MNKIYLFCTATGEGTGNVRGSTVGGDVIGYALAEDGECLDTHLSSNWVYSQHDMGLTSNWKHEIYEKKYPNGYQCEWVDEKEFHRHEGFVAAMMKAVANAKD